MKNLLIKELRLSLHPTAPLFMLLSAMFLIPNYPYYVIFFYTGLAIFFTCLSGRENHDIFYTMLLPVRKSDVVRARYFFAVILELIHIIISTPFILIRQHLSVGPNAVGMDANAALIGMSLIMLGIFNTVFFGIYFKDSKKVGKAFAVSSVFVFLYICIVESLVHIVPFFKTHLDTTDAENLIYRILALAVGLIIYVVTTFISFRRAIKNFDLQDLN